jgi:hypothetical protein
MGELNQLDFRKRFNLASSQMPSRDCWLDGEECPYGRPEGKFIFRPMVFCKMPRGRSTGCSKLVDERALIEDFCEEFIGKKLDELGGLIDPNKLEGDVAEQEMLLSDKIKELAEKLPDSEREILDQAAEILEKAEEAREANKKQFSFNPDIVESSVIDAYL